MKKEKEKRKSFKMIFSKKKIQTREKRKRGPKEVPPRLLKKMFFRNVTKKS